MNDHLKESRTGQMKRSFLNCKEITTQPIAFLACHVSKLKREVLKAMSAQFYQTPKDKFNHVTVLKKSFNVAYQQLNSDCSSGQNGESILSIMKRSAYMQQCFHSDSSAYFLVS